MATREDDSPRPANRDTVTIVLGLGPAQSGHDSLQRFFSALPPACAAAFVVVYHAGQQERLTGHLKASADLPVRRIKNHMPVLAGHVFVAPRKATVTIKNGKFRVSLKHRISRPIDAAMTSLAQSAGRNAIAVLFSPQADDGHRGLDAVRSAGGLALRSDASAGDTAQAEQLAAQVIAHIDANIQHAAVPDPAAIPAGTSASADGGGVESMLADLQLRERAIAAVDCGILIVDMIAESQPILYANEGFERMTGYAAAEAIGRNCRFLQGPDTAASQIAAMREAIEARREFALTLLNRRKDGSVFWNELRLTPVRDASDITTHYVGVLTDVTSRVEAQENLRKSELQLRALLDSTAEAIYGLDLNGNCTFCNPTCVSMLGYDSADELIGRNMHALIHHSRADGSPLPEDNCVLFHAFRNAEKAHSLTECFWRKDGSSFAVECWSYPIRHDGNVAGAVVTFLDITGRNAVAAELLQRTRTLETMNRINLALTAELDLNKLVQDVTDAGRQITGADIGAFFYNIVEESGESFMLFTLSGAGHKDFEGMPMPRRTAIFEPTFSGKGVIRSGDISKDARYGHNAPFAGMPDGHPAVRSYLAMPVVSRSGTVLGGLLFGHKDADVFSREDEELLSGLAAQAAVGIDNARLFEAAQKEIAVRKQAEQALDEARHVADEANASKSNFLANMSHEIRTPMTAILGYAEILAAHLEDPDNRDCVDVIQRNGRFLLDIVDDILDLSRIEAGEMPLARSQVRVAELMADVRSLMEVRAQEKGLPLRVKYRGKIPETIDTDLTRLRQILINLISNAIKFTASGKVTLVVAYQRNDGERGPTLRFEVNDTGIGMTQKHIDTVFQPFRQADDTITREYGGTGLGLAICKRLAGMLGGKIDVSSSPGKGSRFSLTLPTGHVPGSELVEPQDDIIDSQATDDVGQCRLNGRILVVDDRRDIRYLAQYFLEEAGARVTSAENGRAALDIVQQVEQRGKHFDVILMDMQMPVLDGFAATRQLRNNGYRRPILALTAGAMNVDKETSLAAGCDAHIAKPIEGARLVRLVAKFIDRADVVAPQSQARTVDESAQPPGTMTDQPGQTGSAPDTGSRGSDARRVLIVDDSVDSSRALGRLLTMRGYAVQLAHDGATAIAAAKAHCPDVVVLDLGLPDMSGYEVATELRARPECAGSVLVALSGQEVEPSRFDAAGFDHAVMKPASAADLEALFSRPAAADGG